MKSLLNALQEGRLVELPDDDKEKSLRYLAHLIEAVPEMGGGIDLAEEAISRESSNNTGIGSGIACPHVRVPGDADLLCAVGWSPGGIEYGSVDGKRVHLVVMYYIPDSQKNTYLKEVSSLVKAIQKEGEIQAIAKAQDIANVRNQLLDWVSATIDAGIPETKARMIRLEARQAAAEVATAGGLPQAALKMFPVLIVSESETRQIALCENRELASSLEQDSTLAPLLNQHASFDRLGYRLLYRGTTALDPARPLHDYIAVKTS